MATSDRSRRFVSSAVSFGMCLCVCRVRRGGRAESTADAVASSRGQQAEDPARLLRNDQRQADLAQHRLRLRRPAQAADRCC